ncbi:serine/threonine kinase [Aureococcus anophagefferens]|nr:serine/threonine kinase [Aureococcus anophagefferens]
MRRALLLVAAARARAARAAVAARGARRVEPDLRRPARGHLGRQPVGGAAERDGSWLPLCDRSDLVAALGNLSCAPGLAAELGAAGSASLAVAAGERFSVAVVALEAGGAAVRSCHPLARSCSTALVVEVACLPPVEESIALDGGGDDAARATSRPRPGASPSPAGGAPSAPVVSALGARGRVGGLTPSSRSSRGACSRRASRTATSARLGATRARAALRPGCGKTLLARELGAALGADDDRVAVVNGPELLDKFVGVARRVPSLFAPAEEWARYRLKTDGGAFARRDALGRGNAVPKLNVVVFDEIDAVCRERGSLSGDTTGARDGVTAQLLACLDGVEDAGNLVVIGTTNRPELLDAALLRPGRLEVKVAVPADAAGRRAILEIHAKGLRPFLDAPAAALLDGAAFCAEDLAGFSGAEVAGFTRARPTRRAPLARGGRGLGADDVRRAVADVRRDKRAGRAPRSSGTRPHVMDLPGISDGFRRLRRHTEAAGDMSAAAQDVRARQYERVCENFRILRRKYDSLKEVHQALLWGDAVLAHEGLAAGLPAVDPTLVEEAHRVGDVTTAATLGSGACSSVLEGAWPDGRPCAVKRISKRDAKTLQEAAFARDHLYFVVERFGEELYALLKRDACALAPAQQAGVCCGSMGFFAPDMLDPAGYDGCAADAWSLGCLALELAAARALRAWFREYKAFFARRGDRDGEHGRFVANLAPLARALRGCGELAAEPDVARDLEDCRVLCRQSPAFAGASACLDADPAARRTPAEARDALAATHAGGLDARADSAARGRCTRRARLRTRGPRARGAGGAAVVAAAGDRADGDRPFVAASRAAPALPDAADPARRVAAPSTPRSSGAHFWTASGGSEEAARDTSRPRTDDLEDGVPLPLLKHGIEVLRALATAAASTAERRVARKDIKSKPPHGSWQALFDASKPSSLVARGYAAKGYGAGPDYGRYWITAAGSSTSRRGRAAVADADAPVPAPPLRLDAVEDLDEDDAPAPVPAAAPARVHAARAARLSKELGTARRSASSARASMAASTSSSHVWKLARREGMPPFDSENPFDDGDVDDWSSDFDSEGSDDDDSDDDDSGGNSRSTQARNVVCRLAVYTGGSGRSKLGWSGRRASADDAGDAPTPADTPRTGLSAAFAAVDGRLVVLSEAENAKTVAACDG